MVLDTLLFVVFAAGFFHPKTKRGWRAMGAYGASEATWVPLNGNASGGTETVEHRSCPACLPCHT